MRKKLPIGISNYREVREDNRYYVVDKSKMIEEFLDAGAKVTLITRPRRFGKTLNMSMLSEFLDITKDSKEIFQDTYIMKTEYASHLNQYPTIFLSFAGAKGEKHKITKVLKLTLLELYTKYDYVLQNFTKYDEVVYEDIMSCIDDVKNEDLDGIENGLRFLMDKIYAYYGKKVMVLIDEYDTPFIQAKINGCYDEIKEGLSNMLHEALKLSDSLQYAMLTGIQRVAKENIFSGLNNLKVCTVRDKQYATCFGFTTEEVQALLSYNEIPFTQEVKRMYNGYRIGGAEIYNPWSMMNYADNKVLQSYWVNTSENTMIKEAMKRSDVYFQKEYEKLLQEGKLETVVRLETSFYEISNTASLWGLFVNAGYLTLTKVISSIEEVYEIQIPNQEVQQEFKKLTAEYLNVNDVTLKQLYNALQMKKKEAFLTAYKQLLLTLPSYYDLKSENSYHIFLLGMCTWLSSEYEIKSNQEVGKGRCDIILKPRYEKVPAFVIELKYVKEETDLEEVAKQAIDQIREKQYDIGLGKEVIYIGMAHYQKEVAIEWKTQLS